MTEKFTIPTDVEETIHVKPTGNPTTDMANMNAAITHIHNNPCGMIKLVETGFTLAVNAELNFTKATTPFTTASLVGSNRSTITLSGTGNLLFGRYFHPDSITPTVLTGGIAENSNTITDPGLSLMQGNLVLIWDDSSLNSKFVSHVWSTGGQNRPGEVFRVIEKPTPGSTVYLDTRAIDDMTTTNPKIYLIEDYKRVRIENFELLGDGTNGAAGIALYSLGDSSIQGIKIDGGGQISVSFCDTVLIDDCQIVRVRMPSPSLTYGIVLGINNNVEIRGCTFGFSRHPVTTGGWDSGANRYGTGKGYYIHHCTAKGGGEGYVSPASTTMFDTHAESYGARFENNQVFGGRHATTTGLYAFNMRGRASIVRNNYARLDSASPFNSHGCKITAPDCVVEGNVFEDSVYGIENSVDDITNPSAHTDRTIIKNNVFRRCLTEVLIQDGRGIQIDGNQCVGHAGAATKIKLEIPGGSSGILIGGSTATTRNVIRANNLDKTANATSIIALTGAAVADLGIYNNQMRDYGAGSIGVAAPETGNYNTAYAAKNITD
jgi:hypothetical protein